MIKVTKAVLENVTFGADGYLEQVVYGGCVDDLLEFIEEEPESFVDFFVLDEYGQQHTAFVRASEIVSFEFVREFEEILSEEVIASRLTGDEARVFAPAIQQQPKTAPATNVIRFPAERIDHSQNPLKNHTTTLRCGNNEPPAGPRPAFVPPNANQRREVISVPPELLQAILASGLIPIHPQQ